MRLRKAVRWTAREDHSTFNNFPRLSDSLWTNANSRVTSMLLAPKRSKTERFLDNTIAISDVVLTGLNDVASWVPLPFLPQMTGIALGMVNILQVGEDYMSSLPQITSGGYSITGNDEKRGRLEGTRFRDGPNDT